MALILNDAVIESNSIVTAGSVVTKGTHIESGSVYAGVPARKVKDICPELPEGEVKRIAAAYGMYVGWHFEKTKDEETKRQRDQEKGEE